MIKNAKVSLSAVKQFEKSVSDIKDYSTQFDKGISCFDEFFRSISAYQTKIQECLNNMKSARDRLEDRIENIEETIGSLEVERDNLNKQLENLEDELEDVPESISVTNEEGLDCEIPNPVYVAIEAKIAVAERELASVNGKLEIEQRRREQAVSINGKLSSQLEIGNKTINTLCEKQTLCKRQEDILTEVKTLNQRYGSTACEDLHRICDIVSRYLSIRTIYESSASRDQLSQGTRYYDDQKVEYRIGDKFVPNTRFQIRGYYYSTDAEGRIVSAEGKLRIETRDRNMETIKNKSEQGYHDEDDRGHLIGHQFGASDRLENLLPMDSSVNKGAYKKMEDELAEAVKDGANVLISVEPVYTSNNARPVEFRVSYSIDGEKEVRVFKNEV